MTVFELARYYVLTLGFSVIPIPAPRPGVPENEPGGGKVPVLAWTRYQGEHPVESDLREWFDGKTTNIAIVTGAISNLVVADADSPAAVQTMARRMTYTPWQVKTRKGFHAYYQHPGTPIKNKARIETGDGKIALDIRGDGGYVIAPPSQHANGHVYVHAGDWSVSADSIPRFWPGWIARPERKTSAPPRTHQPAGDVVQRARAYLRAVPVPVIGQGSDTATLYAACKLVRGFALSEADATALLWEWCGGRAGWTYDWVAQKVAHAGRYGTEPVGALR